MSSQFHSLNPAGTPAAQLYPCCAVSISTVALQFHSLNPAGTPAAQLYPCCAVSISTVFSKSCSYLLSLNGAVPLQVQLGTRPACQPFRQPLS